MKEIGVPWTPEDNKALKLGVPAGSVRAGCFTLEEHEALATSASDEETPLRKKSIDDLRKLCDDRELLYTPEATEASLRTIIEDFDARETHISEEDDKWECVVCDFVAKSKAGLATHARSH